MAKIKQPKIRFKGFTDDWEECKLGDKIIIERGNLPSKTSEINGKYPFFNTGSEKLYSNKYNFDYHHQVIVSGHGSIGNISNAYGKVGVSDGCYVLTSDNLNMYFLFIISEKYLSNHLNKMKTGTIISHTSKADVYSCNIIYPKLNSEQTKIGEFFKTLDDTIALYAKKLEVTKQFKQTMLKKMFPKNGETKPEIRFKGFNEDWEQRKLSDIFNISSGEFLIKSKQIINGKYPVYNGGVSNTGYSNDYNFESNFDGDIIISSRGSAGSINLVKGKYWLGNSCFTLNRYKQEIDTYFILSSIYNKQNDLMKTIQKGTIPSLSKVDILKLNIIITNLHEQKLIGEYFKELDIKINALEKKLEKYKEFKKAMLQKMFI